MQVGRWFIVRKAWELVYRKWLWSDFYKTHAQVIRVKGWRTALVKEVNSKGNEVNRYTTSPCFWFFD